MLLHLQVAMELLAFLFAYLLIVSLVKIVCKLKSKHTKVSNLPPGPWQLPFIGNIHQLFGGLPHRVMRDLAKKHGPIMHLQLGQVSHVVVSSSEMAKQVMKTHDVIFSSRPHLMATDIMSYGSTDIAFSPYGEYWRHLRKICNSELLSPKRVQSFRSLREDQTLEVIKFFACNEGKLINFTQQVNSLMYSTISVAAFGKKTEDQETFIKVVEEYVKLAAGFTIADLYPSVELFRSINGVKPTLERFHSQIDSILEKIISDHKKDFTTGMYEDLVDVLLKRQEESAEPRLTNDNVKAVLLGMFGAGGETSSSTINWAMSEMMRNPSILRRAQEEVRLAFGGEGYVDEEKFDELKYTASVIKETLRLHPPLPLLLPRINSKSVEISGYQIPAKTRVLINAWAMGRDPSCWEDAERFRPERFLGSLIDYKGRDFEYIPFGAGRRICPGMAFGLANVLLPMTYFLYYFDFELPNGMKREDIDMTESYGITMARKNGLYMIPRIRNPLPFTC